MNIYVDGVGARKNVPDKFYDEVLAAFLDFSKYLYVFFLVSILFLNWKKFQK
jgi:hypothetical protein